MSSSNIRTPDGLLRVVAWGRIPQLGDSLIIPTDPLPQAIVHSPATGRSLVSNGHLGADLIRLEAGKAFVPHTHSGDHLLIVLAGKGTVTYDGRIYPTQAGQIYMIEGQVPHAVGAISDHVILAVGSPHVPVDSQERMVPVEYQAVMARMTGLLTCLVCHVEVSYPACLQRVRNCPHCPCERCLPGIDKHKD